MEVTSQAAFGELKAELDEAKKLKSNLLIVTLPGTGMGRMVKDLKTYNLLNFDWAEAGVLDKVEEVFKKAKPEEKWAVTLNYPGILNSEELKKSFFLNHTYRRYYFGLRSAEDTEIMVGELNPKLTETEEIYRLSGGLAQLIKYLAVNGVGAREGVEAILTPLIKAIRGVDEETLEKLGIKKGGIWQGELLREAMNAGAANIEIGFDLSFKEDGVEAKDKLTPGEKDILLMMIDKGGRVTKEEISDIKWGEGKYDEFSDQAINKAMRRLSDKLSVYTIETIPKTGFLLKRK